MVNDKITSQENIRINNDNSLPNAEVPPLNLQQIDEEQTSANKLNI